MSQINNKVGLNLKSNQQNKQQNQGAKESNKKKEEKEEQKHQKTAQEFESILQEKVILNVKEVRYDIIKTIAKKVFGWRCTRNKPDKETGSDALTHAKADWDIAWIDYDFSIDKLKGLKLYQRINHFPGMTIISMKNNLAKYLKLMQKQMPSEFQFFPKTWIYPAESYDIMNFLQDKKKQVTFIVKPINSSQGKGIFLTKKIKDIPRDVCHVVQQYKQFPYLIDKKKFDFRIYVLVTQVIPEVHCFMYKDGLARFATEEYTKTANNENLFMHLTNYAINKESEKFQADESAFKKSLSETLEVIAKQEGQKVVDQLLEQFKDIIIKCLLMGWPHLEHNYKTCTTKSSYSNNRQCFQILGFDIMLDKKLKPWLLEINESPSFNDDTEVDKQVKWGLIEDSFRLLDIKKNQKFKIQEQDKLKSVTLRNKMAQMNNDQIFQAQEKEQQLQNEQQRKYEKFQLKNLGGFQKIYPISREMIKSDNEQSELILENRRQMYEEVKIYAKELFSNQFGVKKLKENISHQSQTNAAQLQNEELMSRQTTSAGVNIGGLTPFQSDKYSKHTLFKNQNFEVPNKFMDPQLLSYSQKMKIIQMNHYNKSTQQAKDNNLKIESNATQFQKFMSTHHSDNRYQVPQGSKSLPKQNGATRTSVNVQAIQKKSPFFDIGITHVDNYLPNLTHFQEQEQIQDINKSGIKEQIVKSSNRKNSRLRNSMVQSPTFKSNEIFVQGAQGSAVSTTATQETNNIKQNGVQTPAFIPQKREINSLNIAHDSFDDYQNQTDFQNLKSQKSTNNLQSYSRCESGRSGAKGQRPPTFQKSSMGYQNEQIKQRHQSSNLHNKMNIKQSIFDKNNKQENVNLNLQGQSISIQNSFQGIKNSVFNQVGQQQTSLLQINGIKKNLPPLKNQYQQRNIQSSNSQTKKQLLEFISDNMLIIKSNQQSQSKLNTMSN